MLNRAMILSAAAGGAGIEPNNNNNNCASSVAAVSSYLALTNSFDSPKRPKPMAAATTMLKTKATMLARFLVERPIADVLTQEARPSFYL